MMGPSETASGDRESDRPTLSRPGIDKDLALPGLSPSRLPDELMQRVWQFATPIGAALAQHSRYVFGNVANPTFGDIKAYDANRVVVLAFQQIVEDSFKIGVLNVCLAPGTTHWAEVVEDQIDLPVDAGDDRW
jgi:hypothetical protein